MVQARQAPYPDMMLTGISRVHYLKSDYVILLLAFWLDTSYIRSSLDSSLLRKWVWLVRLMEHTHGSHSLLEATDFRGVISSREGGTGSLEGMTGSDWLLGGYDWE